MLDSIFVWRIKMNKEDKLSFNFDFLGKDEKESEDIEKAKKSIDSIFDKLDIAANGIESMTAYKADMLISNLKNFINNLESDALNNYITKSLISIAQQLADAKKNIEALKILNYANTISSSNNQKDLIQKYIDKINKQNAEEKNTFTRIKYDEGSEINWRSIIIISIILVVFCLLGLLIHSNNQRQEVITTIKNNAYEYLLNNNDYDCDMELEKLSEYGIDFDTAKNELLDKYEKDKQDIISNIASDYENNKTKFYELKKQYLPIFFDNNEKVFNDAIEQKLGYKELSLKPQPLPKSGVIHNYTGKPAIAPFKIITQDNDENYYIKLVNPYTDKTEIVIFLSGGETKEMNIPIGTYKIKRAAGKTWYGEKYLFGHNSTYVASDELLTFNISGSYVEGHTLTLYKVADGNFSSKEISAEEF